MREELYKEILRITTGSLPSMSADEMVAYSDKWTARILTLIAKTVRELQVENPSRRWARLYPDDKREQLTIKVDVARSRGREQGSEDFREALLAVLEGK